MGSTHQRSAGNTLIVIIVALTFATGLVLGALSSVPYFDPVIASKQESRSLQTGREYYQAVNTLLQTGNADSLRAVLADDFRDQFLSDADSGDLESSIAHLIAEASLHPDLHYAIEDIAASGDFVFATIRQMAAGPPDFAGLELPAPTPELRNEVLKIQDGYVVARWVDAPPAPILATSASGQLITGLRHPEMRGWLFDGHASLELNLETPIVLVASLGVLRIEVTSGDTDFPVMYHVKPGAPGALEPMALSGVQEFRRGDAIIVPPGTGLKIANTSTSLASLVSIGEQQSKNSQGLQRTDGPAIVRSVLMAEGPILGNRATTTMLSIGWAHVPKGASLEQPGLASGAEFAIALDGAFEVTTHNGVVRSATSWGERTEASGMVIGSGRGAAIWGEGKVTFAPIQHRASTFIVVTLIPAQDLPAFRLSAKDRLLAY